MQHDSVWQRRAGSGCRRSGLVWCLRTSSPVWR